MLSIRKELREEIQSKLGLETYFVQPPINVDIHLPIIILEEKGNSQYYRDRNSNIEVVNLSYDISIYTDKPNELFTLMESIDDLMFGVGLKRSYTSSDMSIDNKLWCKTMTYNCKATLLQDGTIQISQ